MSSQCDGCIDSFECVKVKSMLFPRKTISCSISSFSPVNIFILSIAITPPPPKPKYISRIQKTRFEDFIFLSQIFLCDMFDVLNRFPFFLLCLFIIQSRVHTRLNWTSNPLNWMYQFYLRWRWFLFVFSFPSRISNIKMTQNEETPLCLSDFHTLSNAISVFPIQRISFRKW